MATMAEWSLDPRLAVDSEYLAEVESVLILGKTRAPWPWLILVPRVPQASEWFDLPPADSQHLLMLSLRIGAAMKAECAADKINWGALGNVVPQLHLHVVARHYGDPAWPGPIWGHPATPIDLDAQTARRALLQRVLQQCGL